MTDAEALALYRRIWPDDDCAGHDADRDAEIADEVRRMLAAPTLDEAVAVVAWWLRGHPEECMRQLRRDVVRLRRMR